MKWISVKDKMPENNTVVLIWTGVVDRGRYHNNGWSVSTKDVSLITHWMELPEAPPDWLELPEALKAP